MKKQPKMIENMNAVTLIGLIVIIIVLLILAGITINLTIGQDRIITKAMGAGQKVQVAQEEEIIHIYLLSSIMDENNRVGRQLYDKTVENGSIWDIIITKENNKIYGTGWTYIEKGSNLGEYGDTEFSWLINGQTSEALKLEEDAYVELSYNTSLAVTEGLIFNLDSSTIEDGDKESIENQLGENVELVNIDWNETSGLTKTSFNLDGVNDYIKIKYDSEEGKQTLAQNGFTFEFYGVLNGGTSYDNNDKVENHMFKGIFCYWNGNENKQADLRYSIKNESNIIWTAGYGNNKSDYTEPGANWNIEYPLTGEIEKGKEVYMTVTLDTSNRYIKDNEEYYTHTLYINGNKMFSGGYNKKNWDIFIKDSLNSLNYFCVGRCSWINNGYWHYSKMNSYAMRLYNRALTEKEVMQNYKKSTTYRNSLM